MEFERERFITENELRSYNWAAWVALNSLQTMFLLMSKLALSVLSVLDRRRLDLGVRITRNMPSIPRIQPKANKPTESCHRLEGGVT